MPDEAKLGDGRVEQGAERDIVAANLANRIRHDGDAEPCRDEREHVHLRSFLHDPRREPRATAEPHQEVEERRTAGARKEDERFPAHADELELLAAGQRMIWWQREHQSFATHHLGDQRWLLERPAHETDVQISAQKESEGSPLRVWVESEIAEPTSPGGAVLRTLAAGGVESARELRRIAARVFRHQFDVTGVALTLSPGEADRRAEEAAGVVARSSARAPALVPHGEHGPGEDPLQAQKAENGVGDAVQEPEAPLDTQVVERGKGRADEERDRRPRELGQARAQEPGQADEDVQDAQNPATSRP